MSLHVGIPLMLAAALLQATVLPYLRVLGGQPDLVVVTILAWSFLDRQREDIAWAFTGGLALDLLSGTPLGLSSAILMPIVFVLSLTEAQVYRAGNVWLPLVLTASGALAYHEIYMIVLRFVVGEPVSFAQAFLYVTLPSVAFDLILILPAVSLLRPLYDRLHPRRVTF